MFIYSSLGNASCTVGQPAEVYLETVPFAASGINLYAAQVKECIAHWHDAAEIIIVLTGNYQISLIDGDVLLGPGDLIVLMPDEVHGITAFAPGVIITLQIARHLVQGIDFFEAPNVTIKYNAGDTNYCRLVNAIAAMVAHRTTHAASRPLAERSLLFALLDQLCDLKPCVASAVVLERQKSLQLVRQCMNYVNEHAAEPLTLQRVASAHNVSYYALSHLFKKVCGYGFRTYMAFVRVNKAKELLKDKRVAITEIAQVCGFSEHKYLILNFRKFVGMTPTAYRKEVMSVEAFSCEKVLAGTEGVIDLSASAVRSLLVSS